MKIYKHIKSLLTIFLVVFCCEIHGDGSKIVYNADQLRKADELFKAKNYQEALPLYSRLLSVNPEKTQLMYRFGTCLLMAGKEKSNASTFLFLASKDSLTPVEVFYFLGKSYLINNDFVKAQAAFAIYKEKAKVTEIKKYDIENYFRNCENGIKLSSKRKNVIIVNSAQIPFENFYKKFDYQGSSGRVVKASEEFLTSMDRAKQMEPVMYVSNDRSTVYLPSYGKKGDRGKDIYVAHKKADNTWSLPENLGATVNSSADEDFPFMDPDGRTLYFSSNGHNSIGGYDLFKTVYNPENKLWSDPENLGIPINTSGDDFLFVRGENDTVASYSTTEESEKNSISLRKIKMPGGKSETVIISGVFLPLDQKIRRDARITILTNAGDGIITSVHTDPNTGFYNLSIPVCEKYMILVEGGGYIPHAERFDVPSDISSTNLKQVIRIDRQDQLEKLTLQNYFSSGVAASVPTNTFTHAYSTQIDSSSLKSFNIDGKVVFATLPNVDDGNSNLASDKENSNKSIAGTDDIKKEENKKSELPTVKIKRQDKYDPTLDTGPSSAVLHQQDEEASRKEEIKEEEIVPENIFSENVSNKELAEMVYVDAQVMQNEADSLYRESGILKKLASEKEELAVSFKSQAEEKNIDAENAKSLMELANTNKSEASELYAEADRLRFLAASKEAEADNTVDEANEIYEIGEISELFASKNGKVALPRKLDKSESINQESETSNSNQKSIQTNTHQKETNVEKSNSDDEVVATNLNEKNSDKTIKLINPSDGDKTTNNNSSIAAKSSTKTNDKVNVAKSKSEDNNQVAISATKESADNSKSPATINENKADNPLDAKLASNNIPVLGRAKDNTNLLKQTGKPESSNLQKNEITKISNTKTESVENTIAKNPDADIANKLTKISGTNSDTDNIEKDKTITVATNTTNLKVNTKDEPVISASAITSIKSSSNKTADFPESNSGLKVQAENNSNNVVKEGSTTSNSTADSKTTQGVNSLSEPATSEVRKMKGTEKAADSEVASAVVKSNPSVGEAPRPDLSTYGPGKAPGNELKQPVNEEALTAYRSYQISMNKSNELTAQSLQIQNQLERSPFSPQRDSLVRVSNEMSLQSIHEWQAAQQQIKKARGIEPGIDYKMSVNDFTASNQSTSGNSSMQSTAFNSTNRSNNVANNNTEVSTPKSSTNNSINSSDGSAELSSPTRNISDQSIKNTTGSQVTNKSINKNTTAVTGNQANNSSVEADNIDKSNPEYPTYVKLKEEINNKQGQTISDFATALNLNKKSIEEKELENNLRDKAQLEKNETKKKELLRQADEYKIKSEKHEKESVVKFSTTQERISNVKALNSDLAMVKERISKNTQSSQFAETSGMQANSAPVISAETKPETKPETKIPTSEDTKNSNAENVVSKLTPASKQEGQSSVSETKSDLIATSKDPVGKEIGKSINPTNSAPEKTVTDLKSMDANVPNITSNPEMKSSSERQESQVTMTNSIEKEKSAVGEDVKKITNVKRVEEVATQPNKEIAQLTPTSHEEKSGNSNSDVSVSKVSVSNNLPKEPTAANSEKVANPKSDNQLTAKAVKDSKSKSYSPVVKPAERKSTAMKINEKAENQGVATSKLKNKTVGTTNQKATLSGKNSSYSDLNVSEEEIVSASVSKKESAEVLKNLFSINGVSADSKTSDIPMDPQLPDGLVFKVQISAFRKPIMADNFNGIQPLTGESTRPGWIRYCVGMFKTFEPANMVKKEIRKIGYKDAFVVAYYNGKRIELFEAYQMIKDKSSLTAYKSQAAKEIAILGSANIKRDQTPLTDDADEMAFYGKQSITKQSTGVAPASTVNTTAENANNIKLSDGEYAVQVGVFHKSKAPENLASVNDLRSEQINSNLYRFTSGKFSDYKSAELARDGIREQGIKDAFIVLYKNGKSVVASEKTTDLKHEAQPNSLSVAKAIQIKTSVPSKEIVYKVQIGAYKKNVPFNMIESFIAINDKGITTQLDERDLHLFFAGDFANYKAADELRLEIMNKGVKDAFVVALQNGKRVPIGEENKKQ